MNSGSSPIVFAELDYLQLRLKLNKKYFLNERDSKRYRERKRER